VTDAEWDILEVIWRLERATSSQVAEALAQPRGWAPSTVRTFLARMKDKGMLDADRVGKNWVYTATSDPTETRRSAWQSFAQTAFGSVGGALRFLARDAKLTRAQETRLLKMLGGLLLGLGVAATAYSVLAESPSATRLVAVPPLEAQPASGGLVQLEASDALRVARPEHAWATPLAAQELVALAERLRAGRPGAVLTVGDLSRRGGGRLMPHRTHRDGREADIPWPVDAQGDLLAPQAWELLQALSESGNIEAIVIDGELHEGIREAALASGATEQTLAPLLPESSAQATHPSRHVHVRFRSGGAS